LKPGAQQNIRKKLSGIISTIELFTYLNPKSKGELTEKYLLLGESVDWQTFCHEEWHFKRQDTHVFLNIFEITFIDFIFLSSS